MAADASSQGDAPITTADTPSQEGQMRAAAPTPPGPAKDEEAEDAFDPPFTKLMAFVNIDDWAEKSRKAFETSLQAIPPELAQQVAKELQETYQHHIEATYAVEVQARTKIMQSERGLVHVRGAGHHQGIRGKPRGDVKVRSASSSERIDSGRTGTSSKTSGPTSPRSPAAITTNMPGGVADRITNLAEIYALGSAQEISRE